MALADSDPEFLARLGRRVREAREQRGLARKVLSRAARISERYLASLEAGEGNASIILLRRVSGALGLRLSELLELEGALPEPRLKRIALVGLRGAGKTTLGSALAKYLRRPFVELDRDIEKEAGLSLTEIFALYGPSGYRRMERRCLERILESPQDIVLAVGGGIVSEPDTYHLLLAHCYSIWIKAAPEEHMARVVAQGDLRPMAGRAEALEDLKRILAARDGAYGQADAVLDTTDSSVDASLFALRQIIAAGSGRAHG
jgi:XRE family aerobic/anaerobic benzoate catabolism transcriptional regulator